VNFTLKGPGKKRTGNLAERRDGVQREGKRESFQAIQVPPWAERGGGGEARRKVDEYVSTVKAGAEKSRLLVSSRARGGGSWSGRRKTLPRKKSTLNEMQPWEERKHWTMFHRGGVWREGKNGKHSKYFGGECSQKRKTEGRQRVKSGAETEE